MTPFIALKTIADFLFNGSDGDQERLLRDAFGVLKTLDDTSMREVIALLKVLCNSVSKNRASKRWARAVLINGQVTGPLVRKLATRRQP